MDTMNKRGQTFMETFYHLIEWKRLSSSQKLIGLTVLASIVALLMNRWGLLCLLIVTMMIFAYLTDRALTVGWLGSPDPLAQLLAGLERCREALATVYRHIFNTNKASDLETQELRKRSESIASSHIPDLDIDIESGSSGCTFQKKIRLELNSIILLIIRDFVQFWYNTFSYNSQFLKDARQFLFRGFHNVTERISRLGPHKTSAKVIHAYRKHLASFQAAQSMFDHQEKPTKWPQNTHNKARTHFKKLESVDDAFPLNFEFHPALKNKEAEKQYLRSLTKVILLCSCSRDVVSAQSAQLFFIEVLSINVLLPVLDMLSTPDRLYELIIKLTYNDNDAILNDGTIKELIDVEVKRMQLKSAGVLGIIEPMVGQASPEACEKVDECVDTGDFSQNSGQCANDEEGKASCSRSPTEPGKLSETVQATGRKSKPCEDTALVQNPDETAEHFPKAAGNCSSKLDIAPLDGGFVLKAEEIPETKNAACAEASSEGTESEETLKLFEMSENDGLKTIVEETQEKMDKNTLSASSENTSTQQNNHIYGEIVSTNVPIIKPKLQAFKDLFKSKKSKLTEEGKSQNVSNKEQSASNGQKSQSEAVVKSESILPTPRLKSLGLSPLLNRTSGKSNASSDSSNNPSAVSQSGKEAAKSKRGVASDSGSERQTPSPQPTPSPSQPSKGPLSFFKFRKPTLDFKKNSSSAVEEKVTATVSSVTSSEQVDDQAGATPSDQSTSVTVPSVQVSDDSADTGGESDRPIKSSPSPSDSGTDSSSLRDQQHTLSVSSYVEVSSDSDLKTPPLSDAKMSGLFLGLGEDVEEGEEAEGLGVGGEEDVPLATPPDSSMIFQDISIPSTMICQEFRSNSQFTVYQIEYESLHFSETGIPVMKTGTAKRRYREFVNLMSRLEDNTAYKRLLKDVKGPKRWLTLPFKNMDKESVASRQKALEQFLKSLVEVEAVCNGPEMREFLAYEGDSHIAFVKKPTEINVPRIDKMLARTVSGVFDKLKSLPNLPQEVISGIRGRDPLVDRKDSTETDADNICVHTDYSHDYAHDLSFYNMLRDVSESYVRDVQTLGHPELTPSSPTSQLLKDMGSSLYDQILLHVPRVEGDGAEYPDSAVEGGGQAGVGSGQLLLCDAVLDFVVQLLSGQPHHHWLCHQRVLTCLRNVLGSTLDRWVKETVSCLTTEERCLYYIRLLRETVWPGGKLFSSQTDEKTKEEKIATRTVAERLLVDFFPGSLTMMLGAGSLDAGVEVMLESLQYSQLNKHFLYTTIDMLLESLLPEIADPQFQGRLLSRP